MRIIDKALQIIAPPNCTNCGQEGSLLCAECCHLLQKPTEICYWCKTPSKFESTCKSCKTKFQPKHVWVSAQYQNVAKDLIHAIKFERAAFASKLIANTIADQLPFLEDVIVTNVPAINRHVRARGYDQSRLIAKELAKTKGLHYAPLLRRLGTTSQTHAKREERLRAIKGQFWTNSKMIDGSSILLIDDVLTTGATIHEAVRVLKLAGAKEVNVAVFARPAS